MAHHRHAILPFLRRSAAMLLVLVSPLAAQHNAGLVNLHFTGHYRKDAKTSFVKRDDQPAPYEHFANIADLLKTVPGDDDMRSTFPGITSADFARTKEESRNVEIETYMYVAKLEGDNDLHIVIANSNGPGETVFLNTELAGLPEEEGEDFDTLIAVRQHFVDLFPTQNFGSGKWAKLGLKKVLIRGSLIFDADHHPGCPNCPGPKEAKPQTVWEIHPITSIDLLTGGAVAGNGSHTGHTTRHHHSTTPSE